MLTLNTPAPDFRLPDQENKEHTLSETRGKYTLVYFYPKDDTPGCTKEACMIRDAYADFAGANIAVFGISADSPASHAVFAEKYHLPFTLLADESKETIKAYGADGMLFTKRISYLIDPQGMVVKAYPDVDPASHASQILADVKAVIG